MDIQKLIALCEAKHAALSAELTMAERVGDLETMARVENEIASLLETLSKLRGLV